MAADAENGDAVPTNATKDRWFSTGGPWGSGLLMLGIALTVQGISYMTADPADLRPALEWIDQAVPVSAWGTAWVIAGVYSMWMAFTPPQRHVELAPGVGVICLWSAIHTCFWAIQGFQEQVWTRDWTAGVAWGVLAAVLICFGKCINPPTRRTCR